MQLKVNFNVSIRCNKCGARLDAAEEIPSYNYDSIIVVDPHVCGVLTPHAPDFVVCTCKPEEGKHVPALDPNCPVHGSQSR
jgi:hypothetical protein